MAGRVSKKKKGVADAADALSWRQKKALADVEEAAVTGEVEELISWVDMKLTNVGHHEVFIYIDIL